MGKAHKKHLTLVLLLLLITSKQLFCTTDSVTPPQTEPAEQEKQEPEKTNLKQDELSKILLDSLNTATPQDKPKIEVINAAVTLLKDYKITGYSVTTNGNFAFFANTQNPKFKVTYKNSEGKIKKRDYQCDLKSIGWKLEFDLKLDFIFILNTDFNFYDSDKQIELGAGFDIKTPLIDLTYASFKNVPGSILILGIPFLILAMLGPDIAASLSKNPTTIQTLITDHKTELLLLSPLIFGLSYVKGGTLTPVI